MTADVCVDQNGGGMWRFDEVSQKYFRAQSDGTTSAIIAGKFLPDPDALWRNRLDMYDVAKVSDMGQKLKPQPATFALWQHWQGVQNADNHT